MSSKMLTMSPGCQRPPPILLGPPRPWPKTPCGVPIGPSLSPHNWAEQLGNTSCPAYRDLALTRSHKQME